MPPVIKSVNGLSGTSSTAIISRDGIGSIAESIVSGQWSRNQRLRVLERFANKEKVANAKSIDELDGVFSTLVA